MTAGVDAAVGFPFEYRRLDVPTEFAELRERTPMLRVELPFGGEGWLVSRYDDVRTVLSDPRFSRAATIGAEVPRTTPAMTTAGHLMAMDPPEHSRLRRLVAGTFTARSVRRWQPRAEAVTAELIAAMEGHGTPADLVEHFSKQLPVTVVCELLGVPASDRALFQRVAEIVFSATAATVEEMQDAAGAMTCYLIEQVAARRKDPQDDLLSQLIAVRDEDEDRLTEDELLSMAGSILVAGHETTANEVSNFVYMLLRTGFWPRLAAHRDQLPAAIEELLRHVPLGSGYSPPRIATEDVVLGGRTIRAGEAAIANLISANRDGTVFDDAETLDLGRSHNPHLAFGFGPHHCLGAALARLELRVALDGLLCRFPDLSLAIGIEEVVWRVGALARGPKELPVAW